MRRVHVTAYIKCISVYAPVEDIDDWTRS